MAFSIYSETAINHGASFGVNTPNGVCQLVPTRSDTVADGAINERALLEFIKGCYPICDLETFEQRVLSFRGK